jgi:predicted dienelactone hydrolase
MRPLEILIPVTLAVYLLWPIVTGKNKPLLITFLPILTAVLVGAHLWLEGYRWQMIPLYALTGIILLTTLPKLFHPSAGEFNRLSWTAAGLLGTLLLLAVSTALPILLPVPNVAHPKGPYFVGTQTFVLTDTSRRELYSGIDEPRKFMIQVWYPADPAPDTARAPWMNNARIFAREIASYLGLPAFFLDHLELVKTPSYQDAQLRQSGNIYPVIIFSHGWNGFAAQNTGQALELASRGYVVAAVQHTYGAVVTVFPNGEIAENNPRALPSGAPDEEYDAAARLLAEQWAGDISFTLGFLEDENYSQNSQFYSVLDLNSVGVFGHSTGGGAAIEFCGTDSRCKAVLGMDPFMTPVSEQILQNGLSQPALFMFSQEWFDDADSKNNRLFDLFYSQLDTSTPAIGIKGTTHYDFSDLPMLSPIAPRLGLKGPLNGKRVTEITNAYLIAFFDKTLKGKPIELFNRLFSFPEVIELN